jgi:hypothetical protein
MQLVGIVRRLVELGESVDCVDVWEHQEMHPLSEANIEVDLEEVPDAQFRLFENHHFEFVLGG